MTTQDLLESLNEAHRILSDARGVVASYAANQPWRMLNHAGEYIDKQANELLAPLFAEPNPPTGCELDIGSGEADGYPCGKPPIKECADCGNQVCQAHCDECPHCENWFCLPCLSDHRKELSAQVQQALRPEIAQLISITDAARQKAGL